MNARPRRVRGDKGSALVTAIVLLFAFTAGAVVWLARDVNRRVSNRSVASSVAFQAARAGAQQVDVASLRSEGAAVVTIDRGAARQAVHGTAAQLFSSYGVDGSVTSVGFDIAGVTVTVVVSIADPAGSVSGVGSARAEVGP